MSEFRDKINTIDKSLLDKLTEEEKTYLASINIVDVMIEDVKKGIVYSSKLGRNE
jgi:hypothetical protein